MKEFLHEIRMREDLEEQSKVNEETFKEVLEKFKRNNKRNYDFIVKAGKKFQHAIFMFIIKMLEKETKNFDNTILNQIWRQINSEK